MLAFATLALSIAAVTITFAQFRIASAKTKLDLYDRRFAIYTAVLNYARDSFSGSQGTLLTNFGHLANATRESQFLFKPTDGIHSLMKQIQANAFDINNDKRSQSELGVESSRSPEIITHLFNRAEAARAELGSNISMLEGKIYDYIQFKAVAGWTFWK